MRKVVQAVVWALLSTFFLAAALYPVFNLPCSPAKVIIAIILSLAAYVCFVKSWSLFNGKTKQQLSKDFITYMYKMPLNHPVVKNWAKQTLFRKIYLVQIVHVFLTAQGIDDPDGLLSEYLITSFEERANQWMLDRNVLPVEEVE